jgi:hypothetical protein
MARPLVELADVFRLFGAAFLRLYEKVLSSSARRVMSAVLKCRTAALGGHVYRCDACGHVEDVSYNSCRNRHCPKCQSSARDRWLCARMKELLPVGYFHVVFTLPDSLADIALSNKRLVYGLLFSTAAKTLLTIAREPQYLGANIGFFAVLHTWSQTLLHHPHLHCVVPGGGLSLDGTRWVDCKRSRKSKKSFFLPVFVLSRLFRRLFLEGLSAAFHSGSLKLTGQLSPLQDPVAFNAHLAKARATEWVVYSKRPFGGPENVLRYLGRYTHRVALTNHRLLSIADGRVSFTYKDYRHGHTRRVMALDGVEFIRRFLLHVLPDRFPKIRHFGLFASRHRRKNLAICQQLLAPRRRRITPSAPEPPHPSPTCCSACGKGPVRRRRLLPSLAPEPLDSS